MKIRKRIPLIALSLCMMLGTFASAQSSLTIKGASKTVTVDSGKVSVKSSNKQESKDISSIVMSNGDKNVTVGGSTTESSKVKGVVTASVLNVRTGPSTSYDDIGSLNKGDTVTIVESVNGWYKIEYNGGFGYVSADYIDTNGAVPPSGNEPAPPSRPVGKIKKVVVDPGHGGSDPGAIGPNGIREKDIALKVGLKVKDLLKQNGISVVMTRDTDVYLSLEERCRIANATDSDFFISIHNNSSSSPSANGTETFSYSSTGMSADVAKLIQSRMVSALKLTNRGHKTANFYVIKNTKMASALAEIAFISNPTEESLLKTDSFQNKAAQAIVDGIMDYR
ncbi:N-acetylmuramoyl-L-alanine amidase [Clostridium perfringens]